MSEEKTALWICRPRQGGKTIRQLQHLLAAGTTKIVVEESPLKKQRDALLEACKVVYDGSLSELLQYCIDHKIAYSECYLEPAYRIVILKAAIEQAEREG